MSPEELRESRVELGRRLATLRDAAGFTQHEFAPLTNYGRSTIANVETGRQSVDRDFWLRCDELVRAGGELTRWYDDLEALTQQAAQHQKAPHRYVRRAGGPAEPAVGGVSGAAADAYVGVQRALVVDARRTSEHAMDAGAWAVSETTIEQLQDDATDLARGFGSSAPSDAVREARRVRELAVTALERTRRPEQQRRLYLIAAQAASVLASASVDLGLWAEAVRYARAADTYGEMIDHSGARAYARGMLATVAYWTGRTDDAIREATAAAALAPAGIARVRAECILARAWAHRGAAQEVRRALAAAEDARGQDGDDILHDVIGGEFGFAAAQQARCASTAWLQAGRPDEAIPAAETALALTAATAPRSTVTAEARVDLATCRLLSDDLEAAAEALKPLWSMPPQWRRAGLLGRMDRLNSELDDPGWRKARRARQMAEQVIAFIADQPGPPALPST